MTIPEIKSLNREMLTAVEVASIVGADPHLIRHQAHENPEALGFPVIVMKSRVKIPRIPFLRFIGIED
jgi:hypothetical protein